eukprot:5027839-Pleurochrysis_carterae.AAC.1
MANGGQLTRYPPNAELFYPPPKANTTAGLISTSCVILLAWGGELGGVVNRLRYGFVVSVGVVIQERLKSPQMKSGFTPCSRCGQRSSYSLYERLSAVL